MKHTQRAANSALAIGRGDEYILSFFVFANELQFQQTNNARQ